VGQGQVFLPHRRPKMGVFGKSNGKRRSNPPHPVTPSSGYANRTTYQNPKCSQSVRPGMGTLLRATTRPENGSRLEKETETPVPLERTRRTLPDLSPKDQDICRTCSGTCYWLIQHQDLASNDRRDRASFLYDSSQK